MDAWRLPLNLTIRSVGSLNESSSCSKISNSESSFDSNQSVAGSSNSERDRDRDIMSGRNGMESDIEILSNPSQSSIEVLDRKPSEERRVFHMPSLDPIVDDQFNSSFNQLSTTLTDQCTSTQDDDEEINNGTTPTARQKDKKNGNLLTIGQHLTESSSSGSVTDSICTAYENNDGTLGSDLTLATKQNPSQTPGVVILERNDSVLSSMLNNLLQSTNQLLSSKSQKSPEKSQLQEQFKFSYSNYTDADHRLKLYFYQHLFEDQNESFKWIAKGKILDESLIDELPYGFDGIFVISTNKCYVLKYTNHESDDDPTKWLKKQVSVTCDRLISATVLPWKIGISFTIKQIGTIHLLLYDILRTDCLLLHISSNLPETCEINYQPLPNLIQKLPKIFENQKTEMFCLLQTCTVSSDVDETIHNCAFAVTDTHLYLIQNSKWICKIADYDIEVYQIQEMTNLIEYKRISDTSFRIYFLDEKYDKCENWEITFATETCCESTLNAICQVWEKIFQVPLTSC